jgi:hypothetical protein
MFSLGPSVVLPVQPAHWTVGVLINNVFSVAGSAHRPDVNQMLLQYFAVWGRRRPDYFPCPVFALVAVGMMPQEELTVDCRS